ncbi:MAG: hypothetical protein MJ211_11425 [Bacteroidales bacterium]|nr:hypothetical protein [Bacteroidales bacterium]
MKLYRQLLKLITILLLLINIGCEYTQEENGDVYILHAIPQDAGLIIETNKYDEIINYVNNNNPIWEQITKIGNLKTVNENLKKFKELIDKNREINSFISNNNIAISFHNIGRNNIYMLLACEMTKEDCKNIYKTITKISSEKGLRHETIKHDNSTIYKLIDQNKKEIINFSYTKGIFLISFSELLIGNSIRQINSNNSITKNKELKELLKSQGKHVKANLIINYHNFYEIIKTELNDNKRTLTSKISNYAEWSVIDISTEKESIVCSGFSNATEDCHTFINVFKNQNPVGNDIIKYLPSKTTNFACIGISDILQFKNDYQKYIDQTDRNKIYNKEINNLKNLYELDGEEIYEFISNNIIEFTTDYSIANRANDNYIIAHLSNEEKAIEYFNKITRKYQTRNNRKNSEIEFNIRTQSNKNYTIYYLPTKNIFSTFFGEIFGAIDFDYYAIKDSKIILAQNPNAIKEYLNCIETGKILEENSFYKEFNKLINKKSNIFYYVDLKYTSNIIAEMLNNNNKKDYIKNLESIKNLRGASIQYSRHENKFYTNGALLYSDKIEYERYIKWKSPIDSTINIKPQIVKNFETNENNILIQDETQKIYLINKDGKRYWKKQLGEKIIGNIYSIDYYRNGKIQFLFATKKFIHLIDKNGNYLPNYPIELKYNISSEISVFDYENDGNYRIFVPCENKLLYVYTKEGIKLETWNPFETKDKIITPVQYFRVEDKDYLIFADNLKTYILNRRGETRITPNKDFPKAPNTKFYLESPGGIENCRFVTTNSSGEIEYIYISDGRSQSKRIENYSANHNFVLYDINNDGENEFLFSDENIFKIFDKNGEKISYIYTGNNITSKINIFNFSANNKKIGFVCSNENLAYLIGNDGKICKGFPIEGCTEFSITKFQNENNYSIIIGGKDNYLYNYIFK